MKIETERINMRPNGTSQKILETAMDFLMEWENSMTTLDSGLDTIRHSKDNINASAVSSLLFEYFRHKGFIDNLIASHAKKGLVRQDMRLLLACAATQVFFQTGIAQQSAVNIAVDCAKDRNGAGGGAFVNAMLREFLRDNSFRITTGFTKSFPIGRLKINGAKTSGNEKADETIAFSPHNPPISFRVRNNSVSAEPRRSRSRPD